MPATLRGGIVVIGNFDGLHPGHQAILAQAHQLARQHQTHVLVMTFEPHPMRVLRPDAPFHALMPTHLKLRGLNALGVSVVLAQRFNMAFSTLSAEAFIRDVLVGALGARAVVTGEGFVFGHGRSGSDATLRTAALSGAFDYVAVPLQTAGEERYASRGVRAAILSGAWADVHRLLGRPYGWMGTVIHGEKRGRTIGFPTANLMPPPVLWPAYGVYVVRAWDVAQPIPMDGVANWGVRPSFGVHKPLLEVHLPGREIDLYGRRLYVEWIAPIRAEQHFDGIEALCRQISQDCKTAQQILTERAPAVWPCAAA